MLNRRSLRIKAMQRLFAFHQSRQSDLDQTIAMINSTQSVEAGEGILRDSSESVHIKEQIVDLFQRNAGSSNFAADTQYDGEINIKAKQAWESYRKKISTDRKEQLDQMLKQVEEVPINFKWILKLLVLLCQYAYERKYKQPWDPTAVEWPLVKQLLNHPELQSDCYSWDQFMDQIRQWYRELKEDPGFQHDKTLTLEQDRKALKDMTRALFNSESFNKFFEQRELFWQEDKPIIKSLMNKTIKSATLVSLDLAPLSYNWEGDKSFFQKIFESTLDHEEETQAWIANKAQNWEIDRIAILDRILLKMALAEMINFPSIPIKVTINEYIELSKMYSTPKSKKFINGLLDALAADLNDQDRIKKSGRGLIDNK